MTAEQRKPRALPDAPDAGTLARWRDAAVAIADEADALSLRHFARGAAADAKADGSPVTAADRDVEALVRRRVREAFPAHAVLGEEEGADDDALDPDVPTWLLDPIDATNNFVRGIPIWATLLGVAVGGEVVVGVVSAPALAPFSNRAPGAVEASDGPDGALGLGHRWVAARGLGATRDDRPIRVSAVDTVEDAHLLHGGLEWFRGDPQRWEALGRLVERSWRTRGFGDFLMHLLVAAGHGEAAFERDVKPWDVAAPACVVTEAGGRVTSWEGGTALHGGTVLASNARLHDDLVAALADAG